jgi:3-oxoacyl-[acyl-carrier-protein] synthase I
MTGLSISAAGMVTAVGFNAASSLAALRAGISGIRDANLWDAESGELLRAGKVRLPHWWEGAGKFVELVAPAIDECLRAGGPEAPENIPIILAVPSDDRPFRDRWIDDRLLDEVYFKLGIARNENSLIVPHGQASIVPALQYAKQLADEGRAASSVVAGVDSYLEQRVVEEYLASRRVLTPANSNGFIPGEAGSAVLVTAGQPQNSVPILSWGVGHESATINSEEPLRAEGLALAITRALSDAGLDILDVAYRVTDLNGEHYKFKEAMLAHMRIERRKREPVFHLWHPIEFIGDVGAAIGPCALAVAWHAALHAYAPGDRCLCHFSNDNGARGAVILGTM